MRGQCGNSISVSGYCPCSGIVLTFVRSSASVQYLKHDTCMKHHVFCSMEA